MGTHLLRAVVIGAGAISQQGHIPGFQAAGVEIAAICDSNFARAQEVAQTTTSRSALAAKTITTARENGRLLSVNQHSGFFGESPSLEYYPAQDGKIIAEEPDLAPHPNERGWLQSVSAFVRAARGAFLRNVTQLC